MLSIIFVQTVRGRRSEILISCWVIVDAPDANRPRRIPLSKARPVASQSIPWCVQKRLSSAASKRGNDVRRNFRQARLPAESFLHALLAQRNSVPIDQGDALHRRTLQSRRNRNEAETEIARDQQQGRRPEEPMPLLDPDLHFSGAARHLLRIRRTETLGMVHLLDFRGRRERIAGGDHAREIAQRVSARMKQIGEEHRTILAKFLVAADPARPERLARRHFLRFEFRIDRFENGRQRIFDHDIGRPPPHLQIERHQNAIADVQAGRGREFPAVFHPRIFSRDPIAAVLPRLLDQPRTSFHRNLRKNLAAGLADCDRARCQSGAQWEKPRWPEDVPYSARTPVSPLSNGFRRANSDRLFPPRANRTREPASPRRCPASFPNVHSNAG